MWSCHESLYYFNSVLLVFYGHLFLYCGNHYPQKLRCILSKIYFVLLSIFLVACTPQSASELEVKITATAAAINFQKTQAAVSVVSTQEKYAEAQQLNYYLLSKQTETALRTKATQEALSNVTLRQNVTTQVLLFVAWAFAILLILFLTSVIVIRWKKEIQALQPVRPRLVTHEPVLTGTIVEPAKQSYSQEDQDLKDIYNLLYQSARLYGWTSNKIAGFRDAGTDTNRMTAGKWSRLIGFLRQYVETDRKGTRLKDLTLQEFHQDINDGAIHIDFHLPHQEDTNSQNMT